MHGQWQLCPSNFGFVAKTTKFRSVHISNANTGEFAPFFTFRIQILLTLLPYKLSEAKMKAKLCGAIVETSVKSHMRPNRKQDVPESSCMYLRCFLMLTTSRTTLECSGRGKESVSTSIVLYWTLNIARCSRPWA